MNRQRQSRAFLGLARASSQARERALRWRGAKVWSFVKCNTGRSCHSRNKSKRQIVEPDEFDQCQATD